MTMTMKLMVINIIICLYNKYIIYIVNDNTNCGNRHDNGNEDVDDDNNEYW